MAEHSPSRSPGLAGALALTGVPLAVFAWWLLRPAPAAPEPVAPPLVLDVVPTPPVNLPAAPRATVPAAPPERPAASRIAPANSGEPHAEGMLPHPLSPEHERIFRENSLVGSLNGAMDAKDVAAMRALLKQYRDEYPEDASALQDGYAIVADCLEKPGPAMRVAAQRYYDEHVESGLRRYIRRHCLEAE